MSTQRPISVEDVAAFFGCLSDHFGQLAAIFGAIKDDPSAPSHLTALAGAGLYVATDFENVTDCWREDVEKRGVRTDGPPCAVKATKKGEARDGA